jgi:hypothetical protein
MDHPRSKLTQYVGQVITVIVTSAIALMVDILAMDTSILFALLRFTTNPDFQVYAKT